jgi:signal transduction histidine kinase
VSRIQRVVRRHLADILIVAIAIESALELVFPHEYARGSRTTAWFTIPAVLALTLALLARRRFPFAAPAALWVGAASVALVDGRLVPATRGLYFAGLGAAFLLGHLRDERQARLGLPLVVAGAAAVAYFDPTATPGELVFIPILFAVGWIVGFALRERVSQAEAAEARAIQAERDRETAARLAVAEERARIARELHDIVAHSMSVIVLQAGAVRHRLPDELVDDREALRDVERTGRAALTEMRRLLGAMRGERDELELTPQPGLGRVEPLLDEVRRAGLAVELHVEGDPFRIPDAVDLSAYRIIQEGLTNALKHSGAARADVTVRFGRDDVEIVVRDDGRGPSASDGVGHGLIGIRERVKLYGGEMTTGTANGRGFMLSTRLPVTRVEP